jgi:signal transduction histidine kinase
MKTRTQLILIFSIAIIFIIAITSYVWSAIASKNDLLLKESQNELAQEADKMLSISAIPVKGFVYDTYWDELMNAIKERDTGWLNETIVESASELNLDYLWVLDKEGNKILYHSKWKNEKENELPINKIGFIDSLRKTSFRNFFVEYNNNPVQIFTASVQPSNDPKRLTPAQGYLVVGRKLDTAFIAALDTLSVHSIFSISPYKKTASVKIDEKNYIISEDKHLDDIYNKPMYTLNIRKELKFIGEYKRYNTRYSIYYVAGLILILLLLYFSLFRKLVKPLTRLSSSLSNNDESYLQDMVNNKTEFGLLSRQIAGSFKQNEVLNAEIKTRMAKEDELEQALENIEKVTIEKVKAEQAHRAKNDFLSTMSHEIRTPINGVIGIANLLKEEEDLNPRQKEYVEVLAFSSKHLLSIVTDILDFSKIESGNIVFENTSFNIHQLAKGVLSLHEPKASEKAIKLEMVSDERITTYIKGDYVRLTQVLTNLLNNAIKFTDKGGVLFSYKTISENDTGHIIEFKVQDTGIGIKKERINAIFESFSQESGYITSKYGGTGLGLTICKKLVELQGGKISVTSVEGNGSVFSFSLPFKKQVELLTQENAKAMNTALLKDLGGMKILVVEDNKINTLVLQGLLKKWNTNLNFKENGKEAIEFLKQEPCDIVLMDLQMPVMDGKEATGIIRQSVQENYCNIPIVALTADATYETQEKIQEWGFNHLVTKPFNPEALYDILKKYRNQ